ncbi:tryptophan synthase subunit beta [Gemmobacter megaterium]|uniref:tryptophan synthase subunit beta n=1 Tax=Gemmobacter megaterium TaxID=1086013 RepID=UPI001E60C8CC|nr:tryptophan synthase subunit beta [Gemmobacter megaterium]
MRRLNRQIRALSGDVPALRPILSNLQRRPWALVRLPLGLALVAGGLASFLPVLGIWMLPLGLVLVAIDLPLLRPVVSALLIRSRRRVSLWRRRWANRHRRHL